VADFARHVDVRQELHRDTQLALALAVLAAPALDVEAEAPRRVTANLALRQLREKLADGIEHLGVGAGIAARRASDRRLVDVDHLVDVLQPFDARVGTRPVLRSVDHLGQPLVEHLDHQRGLARPADAGDHDELAQRHRHVDVLEVVLARAADDDRLAVAVAPLRRDLDALPPG